MPKILKYKETNQKFLITTDQAEMPIGSIVFWHDHRLIQESDQRYPGKHLINPELIAHVGIIIGYDGMYPIVAHAAFEKAKSNSKKKPVQSVIACRLRAIDDRMEQEGHSFIVFKPNTKNYEQIKLTKKMVEIASKITHRDPLTNQPDYDIPYSESRSVKMSHHIGSLFAQKPKKLSFEKYLEKVTNYQLKETQYAFYHPWLYTEDSPEFTISDNALNIRAGALVPFKNMAQYNHPFYQTNQKENNTTAFTKNGFMCVQFIVWLGQCAMVQMRPKYDYLTESVKNCSDHDVEKIASLSRKYTKKENQHKIHVKKILLEDTTQQKLYSEKEYKELFSWLDHDGKMMAPGTLLKILMDQSSSGSGGGEKPYIVDYYHASNIENNKTNNILDDITDLVVTIDQLNLKHDITTFNANRFMLKFLTRIVPLISNDPIRINDLLENHNVRSVAQSNNRLTMFSSTIQQPIQSTPSHHSLTELHYIGETTNAIMSIFINKLRSSITNKRKLPPPSSQPSLSQKKAKR